jgi:hypothetical protein
MGEAFITRRDNSRDNYEILSGAFKSSFSNDGEASNLDFGKYDYIVHVASRNTATGSHGDTYVVKSGVITEEYHTGTNPQVTLSIDKANGKITLNEKYSNTSALTDASLIIALS